MPWATMMGIIYMSTYGPSRLLPSSQSDCLAYLHGYNFEAQSKKTKLHQTFYVKKSFDNAISGGISEQLYSLKFLRVILTTTCSMVSGP